MTESPREASFPGRLARVPLPRWLDPVLLLATALVLLWHTWMKWPELLADFGLQLYTPWRLSEGAVLYRDVASLYGPFSSYFNATLFRCFGTGLLTLVVANFMIFSAVIAMLYAIVHHLVDRRAAFGGCLFVVLMCGFNQYLNFGNYEFMAPYSHEATHGFAFAVAALFCMMQFTRAGTGGRVFWVFLAGVCCGVTALAKPESSMAITCVSLVFLPLLVWRVFPWRAGIGYTGLFVAGALVPPGVATALFATVFPPWEAFQATFAAWFAAANPTLRNLSMYREWMGTTHVWGNLLDMGVNIALFGSLIVVPFAAAHVLSRKTHLPFAATLLTSTALLIGMGWAIGGNFFWMGIGKPLPAFTLALLAWEAAQAWRSGCTPKRALRLLFTTFALLLMLRMILNTRIAHFGFVLTVPALLCLAGVLVSRLPRSVERRFPGEGRPFALAMAMLLAVVALAAQVISTRVMVAKRDTVGRGVDRFYTTRAGPYFAALISQLSAKSSADQTLAVFPENVIVNYLARRRTPTRYVQFLPSEVFFYGEERMLAALRQSPPDWVVIVPRETTDYGYNRFGKDYARSMGEWILQNYTPVTVFAAPLTGSPFESNALVLMSRKPLVRASTAPAPP